MHDVKWLLDLVEYLALAALMLSIVLILILQRKGIALWRLIYWIMLVVTGSTLIVGGLAFASFDAFFTNFHKILFTNDLWLLDPAIHVVIRVYPPIFFQTFLYMLGLVIFFVTLAMALIALWCSRYER